MENYTRYSFIRHIQRRLMNGCKQNVIRQRDLQFDADGIVVLNHLPPHLSIRLANGEQRVWVECEVEDWTSYNRPESQGGSWILAQKMKIIKELTEMEVYEILRDAA
jgi:hypothetical protein